MIRWHVTIVGALLHHACFQKVQAPRSALVMLLYTWVRQRLHACYAKVLLHSDSVDTYGW